MAEGSDAPPLPRTEVGSRVLVADERGEWLVRSVAKDGSLTCYQAGANGRGRSFRPEWCIPASRMGKGGKPVKVRSVTQAARRARAAWREQAGFPPLTTVAVPPPGGGDGRVTVRDVLGVVKRDLVTGSRIPPEWAIGNRHATVHSPPPQRRRRPQQCSRLACQANSPRKRKHVGEAEAGRSPGRLRR
jgi:hypothetical protein